MTPVTPFGVWLLAALEQRGWTRRQFALRAGVSSSMVGRWLVRHRPTPASCARIAAALGLPLDLVLAEAGHPRPVPPGDASPRREEAHHLVDRLPEPLLIPALVLLRGLADHAADTIHELDTTLERHHA